MIDDVAVLGVEDALAAVAGGAARRDRGGTGASEALDLLDRAGLMAWNATAGRLRPPAGEELALVRRVARADGSVGRIFDGHLNAVERLAVQAPADLAEAELAAVRDGKLRLGVWGGDPRPEEGEPARVRGLAGSPAEVLSGVKTFCSGAGLLDRALVLARDPSLDRGAASVAVWVDVADAARIEIDRDWYASSGLRASESHRVVFHDAPVLARFGGPGSISESPWFSRDALRTAASWAGMADLAVDAALAELAARPSRGDLESLAAGRIVVARDTIDVWLRAAADDMDHPGDSLGRVALGARVAIRTAIGSILAEATAACGSHPYATGGAADRARRDLELFLLQHRLEPGLARTGRRLLDAVGAEEIR